MTSLRPHPNIGHQALFLYWFIATLLLTPFVWADNTPWVDAPRAKAQVLRGDAFAAMVEKVLPSVVSIEIKGPIHQHGPKDPPHPKRSNGSGLILSAQGHIITNQHVIHEATKIVAILNDGTRLNASIVNEDIPSDLALLQIEEPFPAIQPAPLGDSDKLRLGQWIIAIGNPFGLSQTVTAGIVSALGRKGVHPGKQFRYSNFIQTDASINKGNSGGPLVDSGGAIIGITTAMKSQGQGIAFAIPINMVKRLLPQMMQGKIEHAWLGVHYGKIPEKPALKSSDGAYILKVVKGGPADTGGIVTGDIVHSFDHHLLKTHEDLAWLVGTAGVGRAVPLVLLRDGKKIPLQITLAPNPDKDSHKDNTLETPGSREELSELWGLALTEPENIAVVVLSVREASPAEQAGLQVGDHIVQLGDKSIDSVDSFLRHLSGMRGVDVIEMEVKREGKRIYIPLTSSRKEPR